MNEHTPRIHRTKFGWNPWMLLFMDPKEYWQSVCAFGWKSMDFLTPSDFDHFHRIVRAHSGSDSNQVWMESMVIGWSYKRPKSSLFFSWKHTLSRDEIFFTPQIELIFTGINLHTCPSCTSQNLIEIQWHSLKLLRDSNSKSTYIPLSCHQNAIPLRLSPFSQGSIGTHTRHALHKISSKSNIVRRSYTRLRLKEHLYTFELPPKRNPPLI